ncbi:MAG TPA: division/cell wall cluster transcriptional repressor MraZ [Bacteroidota bacterium]|nr:division/cell wall cluster transcriptional repressor MraZ [Bacteroidota bacterium]
MSTFKGRFSYTVDSKGRVALPAKLRKNLSSSSKGNFVVTRGFEKCLYVYPQDEWNRLEETFRTLSFGNPQHRFFLRTILEWATDCDLDSQSRISVPQTLLEYASLIKEGEVIILGVLERIEIWNPSEYQQYQNNQPATYETVAEVMLKPT